MPNDSFILPTLYKKTSNGEIQFWKISVEEANWLPSIHTIFGLYGTDSPQSSSDIIKEGKNLGKKNETTSWQQARNEAQAKWEKQKKKGYVETIKAAKNDEVDELIEGGVLPMLAHKFAEQGHKITYPAHCQPKLDGIRCIAILKDRKCTLWTRTRKQITSMPHIIAEIEKHFVADITLDGELYNHEFKNNFEHIVHLVGHESPEENHTDVQYHIYDLINNDPFKTRYDKLYKCFNIGKPKLKYLIPVDTSQVANEVAVMDMFKVYKNLGYEGCMLRNAESSYINKRSYDLQKVKEFDDAEFDIIGVEEGRGKLQAHVGAFVCVTKDGKKFSAKMSGDTDKLKEYFNHHWLWQGKKLMVKYQGLTGKEQVPRFPVGIIIRDYE